MEQRSLRRGALQTLAATGLKDEELLHYSGQMARWHDQLLSGIASSGTDLSQSLPIRFCLPIVAAIANVSCMLLLLFSTGEPIPCEDSDDAADLPPAPSFLVL